MMLQISMQVLVVILLIITLTHHVVTKRVNNNKKHHNSNKLPVKNKIISSQYNRLKANDSKHYIEEECSKYITQKNICSDDSSVVIIASSDSKMTKNPQEYKLIDLFSRLDERKGKGRVLTFYGLMLAGAIARSISATAVHPLNVIKIMLQTKNGKMPEFKWSILSRGAGSQFIMSVPHGALNFVVTESTKSKLFSAARNSTISQHIPLNILNPSLDFLSSAISTFICSVISTPQMVLTDRIMAGVYENLFSAIPLLYKTEGIAGFYLGWFPAIAQKIPSYALTWMFFQQLKKSFWNFAGRAGTSIENIFIGSFAAAGACCIMIPLDTVKTRIVTQRSKFGAYNGIWDCLIKIINEEGVGSLYRALPPRLLSVTPMIGIQFAVYELMKRLLLKEPPPKHISPDRSTRDDEDKETLQEIQKRQVVKVLSSNN